MKISTREQRKVLMSEANGLLQIIQDVDTIKRTK